MEENVARLIKIVLQAVFSTTKTVAVKDQESNVHSQRADVIRELKVTGAFLIGKKLVGLRKSWVNF